MSKIHVLPDILASQVAAGEVVERPASVVKELVENSLDAGAGRIDVAIQRGGIALIRVVDDGCGMDREDALLCLERHATSKIRSREDLGAIRTLGFRGEAIPSIASVSKFTLSTRERESMAGTRVQIEGGKVISVEECGGAPGTTIEARQLFYNMPARRKFLRSEPTEFSHIEQHVRVQAVAHADVGFSLTHDDRQVFHLPGRSSLIDRVRSLAGPDITERLLEIPRQERDGLTVHGFIGEPGLTRSSRSLQLTFLHGRHVESAVFNFALRIGYGEALPRGQHPITFLFLEMDPGEVDVNVHPAKREVRFRNGIGLQSTLASIIGDTIRAGRTVSRSHVFQRDPAALIPSPGNVSAVETRSETAPLVQWKPPVRQQELPGTTEPARSLATPAPAPVADVAAPGPAPDSRPLAENPYQVLGMLAGDYALMESPEGLVIMDTRAARERVLFEDARARAALAEVPAQKLLTPITLQFSPREFDTLRAQLPNLRRLGIGAEEFGANTIKVDALPGFLQADGDLHALISKILDDLQLAMDKTAGRRLDLDAIAASVCRQASMLAPPTGQAEIDGLVRHLLACEMPYCCPAGRATLIQISHGELARKFGKK